MDLMQQILATAQDLQNDHINAINETVLDTAFNQCVLFVMEADKSADKDRAIQVCSCIGRDREDMVNRTVAAEDEDADAPATNQKLKEAMDVEFQADVALLESVNEVSLVGAHDLIQEAFDQCVERILKSGRKLRMVSKDGKTRYKNRKRAAEACCAATMAAVFSKKAVANKAAAGK